MSSKFLCGDSIYLSSLQADANHDEYASWLNDQETTRYMGSGKYPMTVEALKKYIESYNSRTDGMLLGIFQNDDGKHVGNITLHQIDWVNRFGEVGIIIGDKAARGRGYAKEAIRLIVRHAFSRLNLRKLYTGMISGNEASKKAFEAMGFTAEGKLIEHFYIDGEYHDCIRMGLISS